MRIMSVIGARPEIIQAAPVSAALAEVAEEILVHTGQHYDEALSDGQIAATGLPRPDHNLGVGSRSRAQQLGIAQLRLSRLIESERPDAVLVRGDTNATLSGARAAVAAGVPLVHVEAGLHDELGADPGLRDAAAAAGRDLREDRLELLGRPQPLRPQMVDGEVPRDGQQP